MAVFVRVFVIAALGRQEVDVELDAFDVSLGFAGDVQLIAVEIKLGQLGLERRRIDAEVNHRAEKHVAADAAENIEVKCLHPITETPCLCRD